MLIIVAGGMVILTLAVGGSRGLAAVNPRLPSILTSGLVVLINKRPEKSN